MTITAVDPTAPTNQSWGGATRIIPILILPHSPVHTSIAGLIYNNQALLCALNSSSPSTFPLPPRLTEPATKSTTCSAKTSPSSRSCHGLIHQWTLLQTELHKTPWRRPTEAAQDALHTWEDTLRHDARSRIQR